MLFRLEFTGFNIYLVFLGVFIHNVIGGLYHFEITESQFFHYNNIYSNVYENGTKSPFESFQLKALNIPRIK